MVKRSFEGGPIVERGSSSINIPSYKELLEASGFSKKFFSKEQYFEYKEDVEKRIRLIGVLLNQFLKMIESIDSVEGKSRILQIQTDSALGIIKDLERKFDDLKNQKDLFTTGNDWVLVEKQIDTLLEDIREMKFVVSGLREHGLWQSISIESSLKEQVGVGQSLSQDLEVGYARYDLVPTMIEARLDKTLEHGEDIESSTTLVNSGMAATALALQAAKDGVKGKGFLTQTEGYFELDNIAFRAEDLGFSGVDIADPEEFLDTIAESDPAVIIFEPVGNSPAMPYINPSEVLKIPTKNDLRVVIMDYTLSGPLLDFKEITESLDDKTVLLAVTSLQKLYEEGDDVVSGGMVTVLSKKGGVSSSMIKASISAMKKMIGANMTTGSLTKLQALSPEDVRQHSEVIGRNVATFIKGLEGIDGVDTIAAGPIENGRSLSAIFHLKLTDKIAYDVTQDVLKAATERNLQVVSGMSFGFNNMRLMSTGYGVIRVAPGTENIRQTKELLKIFKDAIAANKKK